VEAIRDRARTIVDGKTTLTGIPSEAWNYRLRNRSALEWILDQNNEPQTNIRKIISR